MPGVIRLWSVSALILAFMMALCGSLVAAEAQGATPQGASAGSISSAGQFQYRFEPRDHHYGDLVTLPNGARFAGKVLEWTDQVLLFDLGGSPRAFRVKDVELFELRRAGSLSVKPAQPDLTVAYIERLPRDPSWHGHVVRKNGLESLDTDPAGVRLHPRTGDPVTFRIHIRNAGGTQSSAVTSRVSLDGEPLGDPREIPALNPQQESVIEVAWPWQPDSHLLRVEVDPGGKGKEIVRWNNTHVEDVRGLGVTVVVARDRYEAYSQTRNMVDSFCFEDYVQYHMDNMNGLFAALTYPTAPNGIVERIRFDRLIVVDDPAATKTWQDRVRIRGAGGQLSDYAALMVMGNLSESDDPSSDALKVDWHALQDLGRQLGLVDLTVEDTTVQQCHVLDKNERYAVRRHISSHRDSLMYRPAGFRFIERDACYLNEAVGRPRGFQGEYQYRLPNKILIEVLANDGSPLPSVQVDVFQLQSEGPDAGRIAGLGGGNPISMSVTDKAGRAPLPDQPQTPQHKTPAGFESRPNPFGAIAADGTNGLLLLRLRYASSEEFHFLTLSECNTAYLRGNKDEFVCRIRSRFGTAAAPPSPAYAAVRMRERDTDRPPLLIGWPALKDVPTDLIVEYRVYKRTSFGGDGTMPWTLVSTRRVGGEEGHDRESEETYFDEFEYRGPYGLDTYFAVTAVDREGRESGLSESGYVPHGGDCVQFAVAGLSAVMTIADHRGDRLLYWDGQAGTQPYFPRKDGFPGYVPSYAGIAFTGKRGFVVTDPVNHVLTFFDSQRHELTRTLPPRTQWPGVPGREPGQFNRPMDVAIDDAGNLYIADYGNDRVQVLDSNGKYKGLIDGDFRFDGPHALGYSLGHLCVTDKGGTRCRVYDVTKPEARLDRELPLLADAGRGLVGPAGRVFITGRASADGKWNLLVYLPDGQSAKLEGIRTMTQLGRIFKPRGLYFYRGLDNKIAYFANMFPFDVRRVDLTSKQRE